MTVTFSKHGAARLCGGLAQQRNRIRKRMSILKATCPQCRTEVDTGLKADEHTIQQCSCIGVLVLCDECREYQKMLVRDLYLAA
jgi:hypothetical protein